MILGRVNANREAIIQIANASETETLVGMGLLEDYKLEIERKYGGVVRITALP
jgi:hypothetical protein